MYNDTSAKMQTLPAAGCNSKPEQPLISRVNEMFDDMNYIRNMSENVKGKLFGAQPIAPDDKCNPCCLEDVLENIRNLMRITCKTLSQIDERL